MNLIEPTHAKSAEVPSGFRPRCPSFRRPLRPPSCNLPTFSKKTAAEGGDQVEKTRQDGEIGHSRNGRGVGSAKRSGRSSSTTVPNNTHPSPSQHVNPPLSPSAPAGNGNHISSGHSSVLRRGRQSFEVSVGRRCRQSFGSGAGRSRRGHDKARGIRLQPAMTQRGQETREELHHTKTKAILGDGPLNLTYGQVCGHF